MEKKNNIQKYTLIFVSMILLSFLYVYSFYRTGTLFVASDRIFHLERMEEVYQSLKSGHLINQISTYSAKSVGIAVGRFYPSVNLVIYSLIRLILQNPIQSIYVFIFTETLLGLVIAFYAGNVFFNNKKLAYLFAIQLRLSTYVMHNDFSRFDIGESWSLIFVPLSLVGFYLILKEKRTIRGILLLSLGVSLELYSHILTAFITVLCIIIMYFIYILLVNKFNLKKLISFFISSLIIIINTVIVTVPLLEYYLKVGVVEPEKIQWDMYDFSFVKIFNTSLENSISSPNLGVIGIVTIILIMIIMGKQIIDVKVKLLTTYIIFFLVMVTNLFPWMLLTDTPINIIQYPWRLMAIIIPLISVMFVYVIDKKIGLEYKRLVMIIIFNIIISLGTQNIFIENAYKTTTYAPSTSYLRSPWGYLIDSKDYNESLSRNNLDNSYGYHDYIPKKSEGVIKNIYNLEVIQESWKRKLRENEIKRSYHKVTYDLSNLPKKSGEMKLPFIIYRNSDYRLFVNNHRVKVESDKNGQLVINKDNKSRVKVEIEYLVPTFHKILLAVSIISVLFNIIVLFIIKFWNI